MSELGYHPNLNARNLANQTTKTLGLVMPSSASKAFKIHFPRSIRGISSFAHEIMRFTCRQVKRKKNFNGVVKMVQGRQIGGIILLYSRENDRIIQYLHEQKFPFVLIENHMIEKMKLHM